ncbi:MAG: AAA family ATPase [Saprospiraceae bacterium]|nr:AAA family ATPase [Saprospiraceae bacterium]
MIEAFVFGKFLPFHKGHEAMVRFALTRCDRLTILVCCSDRERVPASRRVRWINQTFIAEKRLKIEVLNYREHDLPNTSVSSRTVSEAWSNTFKKMLPEVSLLITSEPYGDFVAEYMGIHHIPFDLERHLTPVSATAIRADLFQNWSYLPDAVKSDFAIKVALSGTESTGKSTIAKRLADHFHGTLVDEAGRELIPNSNHFTMDDLDNVAHAHTQRIRASLCGNSPLIFLDTTVHTTISYGQFFFGKLLEASEEMLELNRPHICLYSTKDAPFIQDGTRLSAYERNELDRSHRDILQIHQIPIIEISGSWEERYESAKQTVSVFLKHHVQIF